MKNDVLFRAGVRDDAADKEVGVPSFRRRDAVIDADRGEGRKVDPDRAEDAEQARALADEADAEAAEADALAAAARARARAARLRREALADSSPVGDGAEVGEAAEDGEDTELAEEAEAGAAVSRPRPKRTKFRLGVAAIVVAVLGTVALLGLTGYMLMEHRDADRLSQLNAEYSAAGRQSVVTLMSLDFTNAQADVQRIIDNSTGQFKSDFESQAAEFVKVAQDSKVVTEVTVNSSAVESMTPDNAEVLVAASSRVTNTAGANQEPRTWRLSVSLVREDGQIKMSKVEFVP